MSWFKEWFGASKASDPAPKPQLKPVVKPKEVEMPAKGPSPEFFKSIRSLFGGKLTQGQVDGMNKIVEYGYKWEYSDEHLAYVLATTFHETARWMQPIREGARRYGPSYKDSSAKRAVASIFAKGIIRTNYALPAGPYKQSYYGRGLVQITWHTNYKKFAELLGVDLEKNPDLALEWGIALDILFLGMRDGLFTGKALNDYNFPSQFYNARAIVNGDTKKNGKAIANEANAFLKALKS